MQIVKKRIVHNQADEEVRSFFFKNYKKNEVINVSETAKSLGVSRVTIYKWMKQINSKE